MKTEFLVNNKENNRLILIFAGWGSSPSTFFDCKMPGWDTLIAYDYDDFIFPTELVEKYTTVYLYAWSLGVYAAQRSLNNVNITAAFAINGTLHPVDNERGIAKAVFSATRENLSDRNLAKFRRRMVATSSEYTQLLKLLPENPDIEQLKLQLLTIEDDCETNCNVKSVLNNIRWNRAYISADDHIFPAPAQRTSWESLSNSPTIISLDGSHYLEIKKIIRATIHDLHHVGERFKKAISTYDSNATAQQMIALRFANMITEYFNDEEYGISEAMQAKKRGGDLQILEIGPGSGMFTRYYAPLLKPHHITFVDLYDMPAYKAAESEKYIIDDAERWLEMNVDDAKFDIILSTSAIQWFVNLQQFFRNASARLNKDGILACSTFLPGNLVELDSIRPTPIMYANREILTAMAKEYFEDVEILDDTIRLQFATRTAMLRHLALTGVGGSMKSEHKNSESNTELSKNIPLTLTYRPVYIICRKSKLNA